MPSPLPLADVRVLECTGGIPGAYCGKMLTDAGAQVVKLEPPGGDPLRAWSASGDPAPGPGEHAPLFQYLAAGKRSVVADRADAPAAHDLIRGADVVVVDGTGGWDLAHVRSLLAGGDGAVLVSITPFGTEGPYADQGVQANEFILQAMCGSIEGRGWPGEEPLQAGGRIGEWVAGAYAAFAAAAGFRRLRRTGGGDVFDVSVLEAMVVTMGGLGAVGAEVLGADAPAAGRNLEMPSIVPTADGLVGFCTITAQQFADFLVLIDRADLLDDAELASFAGRIRRREEFLEMVHGWAATRTTAEIVELAAALRIPVAPIGTPETLADIDQFRERGVFVKNALGHLQPRVPYRASAFEAGPPGPVPELGGDTGAVRWPARERTSEPGAAADRRPLDGVRVADFTAFWAGPTATQLLSAFGADVVKIEGLRRPDGMRFSGGRPPTVEQWWEWGSVFLASNNDKRGLGLELSLPRAREIALRLIAGSDLVVENFSPRVMANFGLEWPEVSGANPRACMVRMPAFGLDGPWRDRVGFAQTMEQASGMAWMTGHPDGPPIIPRGVCDPVAGVHAAFAAVLALESRDATGRGVHVEGTMVEAALNVAAEALLEHTVRGVTPRRDGNRGPGAAPQGVYRTAGPDEWAAVAVTDDAQWPALAAAIGRPDLAGDPGLATRAGRAADAARVDEAVAAWAAGVDVATAVAVLRAAGVPAARVTPARDVLDDEHLRARGFWEHVRHPVAGEFRSTGLPFGSRTVPSGWVRDAAPLFGAHNREVLAELGLGEREIAALEEDGIIGSRPAGL
ncbi:CoA transferase [Actinomadura sp. NAK00032]|uniref:CaiB/BaiF CoA-transferase family protein n=1 Tax=Actinomadura sp. NAK00032 TaxID=2742128 RepID=UPI00159223C7|nr:CoA transferase [Actinomadura sp. NAK00032]QKW35555.1 CoA transferase [Actinomadura sp. NAK00032]